MTLYKGLCVNIHVITEGKKNPLIHKTWSPIVIYQDVLTTTLLEVSLPGAPGYDVPDHNLWMGSSTGFTTTVDDKGKPEQTGAG